MPKSSPCAVVARLWRSVARSAARSRPAGALARSIAAGVVASLAAVGADAAVREDFGSSRASHLLAAVGLYAAAGASLGLSMGVVALLLRWVTRPLAARSPRAAVAARAAATAALMTAALSGAAFWAFSGRVARTGRLAAMGPYLVLIGVGLAAFAIALVHGLADRAAEAGRPRRLAAAAAALAFLGAALVVADLTVLVAIYKRVHTAVEMCGAVLLLGAFSSALTLAARRAFARALVLAFAAAASLWALGFLLSPRLQAVHEQALAHAGRDSAYLGRMLRRLELWRAVVRGDDVRGLGASRLAELLDRYDVDRLTRDPRWDAPWSEPPAAGLAAASVRELVSSPSVLVFYVDTLRSDVAYDDEVMPNAAAFSRQSIRFERAYSTGSDTVRALPGLLGGSYDGVSRSPGALLSVAKRQGMDTALFIANSAADFLGPAVPEFAFDETHRVSDYAQGGVWGYGADQPTAGPIVDRVLTWLAERGEKRFFAWLFNFDVHNWRELDRRYVYGAAERYRVPDEGRWNWRYRVVARALDEQFGRLLRGLRDLGLADRTLLLFVSDHGESLNYRGFWIHSTFLWEPLLRVPLFVHIPGAPPAVVDDNVSLVDVAPTLARLLEADPPMNGYHGQDLLGFLARDPSPRRLPLLAAAVSDQQPARVAIIDDSHKLVLPLDWGSPELYDLTSPEPDDVDLSASRPGDTLRLMSALLRSPVFLAAQAELEGASR